MRIWTLVIALGIATQVSSAGSWLPDGSDVFDFEDFRAAGFAPNPQAGQLDSNLFRVVGASAGAGQFGGNYTDGDFARGTATSGVSTGGVYAFDVSNGLGSSDWALGLQATGTDFTPGGIEFRLTNGGPDIVDSIQVDYDLLERNNGDRSGLISFYFRRPLRVLHSTNTLIQSAAVVTPQAAESVASWVAHNRDIQLEALALLPGEDLILGWQFEDVAGRGSRDEFGLDNLSFRVLSYVPEPASLGLLALAACGIVPLIGARGGRA